MVGNASGCFKNGIILTSLSRNFFTGLRKASVDMPKPEFASSISQSANDFFFFIFNFFFLKKKKLGEGTSIRRSKVTLLFSLTFSVDFFMLSPNNNRGGSRIFFRRGCTRLLLYFNTNKPLIYIFFCRIPVVLENRRSSQGGGCAPPAPSP